MSSLALAQKIVGALKALPEPGQYNESTPIQMNEIIAREITSYLLMNCVVVVDYAGMVGEVPEAIAGPNPIKGVVAPSVPGDAITWLDTLGRNIAIGFLTQAGVVRPLSPHISLQVPNDRLSTFIPVGNCKEIHDSPDPCLAWWTKVAEGIFMMINTQIPKISSYPASLAGTGIATVTKLVVV